MTIELYPADEQQDVRMFQFLFESLRTCADARFTDKPRPLPRQTSPRSHESVWIDYEGLGLFVDMSDHTFLIDIPALRACDLYLKANLNEPIADRVLAESGANDQRGKLHPFIFLPPTLDQCRRICRFLALPRMFLPQLYDICHIVGVYQNPFLEGVPIEADQNVPADPVACHFWIRYQTQQALREAGLRGIMRLTSRCNTLIEDDCGIVRPNISNERFLLSMLASRLVMINTLPHSLLPWKAFESVALGIPFVVERAPLVTMPEPFALYPGQHYIELLPDLPGFEDAPLSDIRSYRLFPKIHLDYLRERAHWLKEKLRDNGYMADLSAEVRSYGTNVLTHKFVVSYIDRLVRDIREKVVSVAGSVDEENH